MKPRPTAGRVSAVAAALLAIAVATPVPGQIVVHPKLDLQKKQPIRPNDGGIYTIPPGLGTIVRPPNDPTRGGNLFFSFDKFNVAKGETAHFTDASTAV